MLDVYIGLPRSGKSTFGAKLAKQYLKKGIPVYSNCAIKGCIVIDSSYIGRFDISGGVLILDEAGIDFNNRNYKGMSKDAIQWFKLYGHYHMQHVIVLSQAFDFDVTIRRLADQMHIIKRLGPFTLIRHLKSYWDLDPEGQPVIKWRFQLLPFGIFLRRPYYSMFDSYAAPTLPQLPSECYIDASVPYPPSLL